MLSDVTRESVVTAALGVAEREGAVGLTMRRLAEELDVDATVMYRLFGDKDGLLLAVADRVYEHVLDALTVTADDDWRDRLVDIAEQTWAVSQRFPAIFSYAFARTTGGPAERAIVEFVLGTFARLGLPGERTALWFRAYADALLSMCGQMACLLALAPDQQEKDASAWTRIYAVLPQEEYRTARALAPELAAVDAHAVYRTVIEALLDRAAAEATPAE